ncbi:MAG: hypothetical protein ACKVJE_22040, partial [Pseudomonadales bacterium]
DILQNPIFATGIGLLHYASQGGQVGSASSVHMPSKSAVFAGEKRDNTQEIIKPVKQGPGLLSRVKDWFKGNF